MIGATYGPHTRSRDNTRTGRTRSIRLRRGYRLGFSVIRFMLIYSVLVITRIADGCRVCRVASRQRVSLPIRLYSGACVFGAFWIDQKAHKRTAAAEHTRKGARPDAAFGVYLAYLLLLRIRQHTAAVCQPFKRDRLSLCVWFHVKLFVCRGAGFRGIKQRFYAWRMNALV